jgi:DNA-directed RNA polymerase specialized sigma24 family protein
MRADDSAERGDSANEALRAAFRDLHGRHLHGFALLMVLGDGPRAAQLAADALNAGVARLDELRHPERAAAWLRARVVRSARGLPGPEARLSQRLHVLEALGADVAVVAGLAALGREERAALIATGVERLDRRGAAALVGRPSASLDRRLARARRRYAAAHRSAAAERSAGGPLVDRIRETAARAIS